MMKLENKWKKSYNSMLVEDDGINVEYLIQKWLKVKNGQSQKSE